MKVIDWIKENIFGEETITDEYIRPVHRPCHNTLVYKYAEKYMNGLNPNYCYDVREELKSGMIVTHKENITLREAKDYVRMIWIESSPPNIILEVTTSW